MNAQEQEAQNGQNTNTPAGEQTIKDLVGNFTPVPNSVLDTPTLSSNAKVVFGDLLATYLFARDTNQLVNGSFYRATNAIAERMDISPSQIRNAVLPELYDAGLVEKCDERRDVHGKFTNAYKINFDVVKNFKGADNTKVEAKTAKAKKAMKGRVDKETLIKQEFLNLFIVLVVHSNCYNEEELKKNLARAIMARHPEYTKLNYVIQMVSRIGKRVQKEDKEQVVDYIRELQEKDEQERHNRFVEQNFGGAAEYYEENYAHDTCEQDEYDDDEDCNPPF